MKALQRLLPLLALLLLGGLVYWPGLEGGFIFDDYPNLVDDPDWKVTSLEWAQWRSAAGSGIASIFGRPLAVLSFAVNYYFTGMDPWPMKLAGLLLHLGNGVLVFWLCRRLFALAMPAGGRGSYLPWLLALAWIVHPLQVSTVLYVVQRMEVGAHLGVLLALLSYLRARSAQMTGGRAWPWWLACGAATLFGLGFKETALLVPGYALMLEVCLLRSRGLDGRPIRGLVVSYVVGAATAGLIFVLKILPSAMAPGRYALRDFTLGERLLTQLVALVAYLRQMLLPWPEGLWFYYDNFPVSHGLFSPPATLWALTILLALLALAIICRRRWPMTTLGIAWFFVAHALTSNVMPLELVFEHRNYFALLGILLAVVQPLAWLGLRLGRGVAGLIAALLVAFIAFLGFIQVQSWADPLQLALTLSSRNPESSRAGYELGRKLLERAGGNQQSPLWSLAEQEFHRAGELPGSSPLPEQALIILSARYGRPLDVDVWPSFQRKILRRRIGVQEEGALRAVVECRVKGECQFADERPLFDVLGAALSQNPRSARLHALYGSYAYNVMGDHKLGVEMLREAVRLSPDAMVYRIGLAKYLLASNLLYSPEVVDTMARLRAANADGRYDMDLRELEQLLSSRRDTGDPRSQDGGLETQGDL